MTHETERALIDCEGMKIRSTLKNGWYLLRCGRQKRVIAAGTANTIWANNGWPRRGSLALLWVNAREVAS